MASALGLACAAVALSGATIHESLDTTVAPAISSTPVSEAVGGLTVACDELVSPQLVAAAVGPHADVVGREGLVGAAWNLPEAAVAQDGGITCRWPPVDPSYDWEQALSVSALPNAASVFAQNLPTLVDPVNGWTSFTLFDLYDGAAIRCLGSPMILGTEPDGRFVLSSQMVYGCEWNLLSGDVWIRVELENLPASEVTAAESGNPVAVVEGSMSRAVVDEIVASIARSARTAPTAPPPSLPTCEALAVAVPSELFTYDEQLDEMVPVELDLSSRRVEDYTKTWMTPRTTTLLSEGTWGSGYLGSYPLEMWRVSFDRLGFRDCAVTISPVGSVGGYVLEEMLVTRGLGWLVSDSQPDPLGERIELDGLGVLYDGFCYVEPHCSYLFANDDILIGFGWYSERDEVINQARGMLEVIEAHAP